MKLPKLPNKIRHYQPQVVQFGGLNLTAAAKDGEFVDCSGVSTRDYPFLKQKVQHIEIGADPIEAAEIGHYDDPWWAAWYDGHLYVIDDGYLKKNGTTLGYVGVATYIKAAIVNTKMIFWGLGRYCDLTDDSVHFIRPKDLYAQTGNYTISGDTITYSGLSPIEFVVGDVVDVYGADTNNKVAEGNRIIVAAVTSTTIEFEPGSITHRDPITNPIEIYDTLSVKSSLPDLDYVCESGNRLWGCCSKDHTIYVSALGDPSTFFDYTSDLGAFSVAVSGDSDFTGICAYNNYVCVWKEDRMYKIMGSFPSEYYLAESKIPGVSGSANGTLTIINGLLYYAGGNGDVYVYGGNRPTIVSQDIGSGYDAYSAMTDGDRLYSFMYDQSHSYMYMYVYDLLKNMWVKHSIQDGVTNHYTVVTWSDDNMYILETYDNTNNTSTRKLMQIPKPGDMRHVVSSSEKWYVEMVPVTEQTFNRKGFTKIILRLDMANGSSIAVKAKEDRRAYRTVWSQQASNDCTLTIPIRLGRCDRYQIRLEGEGEVTIRGMAREYVTGSDIN